MLHDEWLDWIGHRKTFNTVACPTSERRSPQVASASEILFEIRRAASVSFFDAFSYAKR